MHHEPKWHAEITLQNRLLGGGLSPLRLETAAKLAGVSIVTAQGLARRGKICGAISFGRGDWLVGVAELRRAAGEAKCSAPPVTMKKPRVAMEV
jgi:hypothetical protein